MGKKQNAELGMPFGPVFDPEAQTRRELVAEGLVADWNL
jgi:hypothetical protein